MTRLVIAAIAAFTFAFGTTATCYACGSNTQAASKKKTDDKNKVKAEKSKSDKKRPDTPA